MADLVVTVPRDLWVDWIAEGDAVGEPETGEEWGFMLGWQRPPIAAGDRLYIVAHDRLRGFAPVTRVAFLCDDGRDLPKRPRCSDGTWEPGRWAVGRRGGAQAITIGPKHSRPERADQDDLAYIRGFQGFALRWWPREDEFAFEDWKTRDLWLNRAAAQRKREIDKAKRAHDLEAVKARQGSMFGG